MKKLIIAIVSFMSVALTGMAQDNIEALEKVISERRSIRKYTEQAVSRETLDRIVENGLKAPSGMNRQSYELRIVDDPAILEAISRSVSPTKKSIFLGAPAVIFIANGTSYDLSQVDCGLLAENIMLSAQSLGLGTCCMGAPIRQMNASEACAEYIEKLGFSNDYNLLIAIAIGYPNESPAARPRKDNMIKYVK